MFAPENRLRDWIREAEDRLPYLSDREREQVAADARLRAARLQELRSGAEDPPPPGAEELAGELREALVLLGTALESLQAQAAGAPAAAAPAAALADEAEDLLLSVEHRMIQLQGGDWEG